MANHSKTEESEPMSIRRKQTSQVGAKRGKSHVTRSGVANWLHSRPEFIKSNHRVKKSSVEVGKPTKCAEEV